MFYNVLVYTVGGLDLGLQFDLVYLSLMLDSSGIL